MNAQALMSSPVRSVSPEVTIDEAWQVLLRYGHTALCVVDPQGILVGLISRRDLEVARHHGLGQGLVEGWMSVDIKGVAPESSVAAIQALMTTYDIGRVPVLKGKVPVGIVTRSDLLRHLPLAESLARQALSNTQAVGATQAVSAQSLNIQGLNTQQADAQGQRDCLSIKALPSSKFLREQLAHRLGDVWPALRLVADAAEAKDWDLYLVGGGVRDLLLGLAGASYPLKDIDLVVEGAYRKNSEDGGKGAGVVLAEALQAKYPDISLQVHHEFQTASLTWPLTSSAITAPDAGALSIDIATARTEFYPYPAANPEVEPSTIRQDLYRRDFTINAMALRLSGPPSHALLDYFGGWQDLQQGHVRVLHSNSFIEDPTRIFRAVKFATRLGFSIDGQSERLIHHAIDSGFYAQVKAHNRPVPALQSRLKAELKQILSRDRPLPALDYLERLGAWTCLHSELSLTPELRGQIGRMLRWIGKFGVNADKNNTFDVDRSSTGLESAGLESVGLELKVPRWLMLLELMIAQLSPDVRDRVAKTLDLPTRSCQRLQRLHQSEAVLLAQLTRPSPPSDIYKLLKSHELSELLLMCDRHPYTLGPQIWHYVVRLSRIPPLLNGGDLKRLGYSPGPQFREILTAVHEATLNGELATVQAAEAYVLNHYPANGS